MNNYSVGQKCSGRIIIKHMGDLIVELEQGVVGRIENGADGGAINSFIDVVVRRIDDQEILLDFAENAESIDVNERKTEIPWNSWPDFSVGHRQAVAALLALRDFTNELKQSLSEARAVFENTKANNRQVYEFERESINKQFEKDKANCLTECEKRLISIKEKSDRAILEAKATLDEIDAKYQKDFNVATESSLRRYDNEIQKCKEEYENSVSRSRKINKDIDRIVNACKDYKTKMHEPVGQDIIKALNEVIIKRDEAEEILNNRERAYHSLYEVRKAEIEKVRDSELLLAKALMVQRKVQAERGFDEIKQKEQDELKINRKACLEQRDKQIAAFESARVSKLDQAKEDYAQKDVQANSSFAIRQNSICDNYRNSINSGFNQNQIHDYETIIKAKSTSIYEYECPVTVPEFIAIGRIGLSIPNKTQDDSTAIQVVKSQTSQFATDKTGEYIVEIPYAQRLKDGISLLIRYTSVEREYVQGMIQSLLLKLFMSFPAGKLEATMIDPLELGASFFDISKLGQGSNAGRIIDTRVWSKERDIETAIATLRQHLENLTQAYGGNYDSRLNKESIRALAIMDFPIGFTDAALKDLHAIVRNSSSLGVCVLICANKEELEKLKEQNAALVSEMAHSVVDTIASGKRFELVEGSTSGRIFLNMDDLIEAIENKDTIIQRIIKAIDKSKQRVVGFDELLLGDVTDSNNWFKGNSDEISIPIGIKGADTVVNLRMGRGGGSTEHHALIAGSTGAGKSTLLHTVIMSTLINYSPEEIQMYLLDFKEGVEFSVYTRYRLPSLRVVAIHSEREFGLSILKELCSELEIRTKLFSRNGVADINSYLSLKDVQKVPRLLLIFDEVQELFRNRNERDSISNDCLSCLNRLVMQGRAMGIHIILACQDFRNCSGLEAYFSQMAIRIAISGSEEGAASILSTDNKGISSLKNQPAGAAIYNGAGGIESANTFFQISIIEESERKRILELLEAYYTDLARAPHYVNQQTRILLTNAEDNIHNCFNRLIANGLNGIEHLAKSEDGYGLVLGQGFGKRSTFITELLAKERDNLLVVCKDERMAMSIFDLAIMSVLYENLYTRANSSKVLAYIINLSDVELAYDECDIGFIQSLFPNQIVEAEVEGIERTISSVYKKVLEMSEGGHANNDRVFLFFFGINRARCLRSRKMYEEDHGGEVSPIEMIQKIFSKGPRCGVNSVVWGESIQDIELVLGNQYDAAFDKRIAYGLDKESMETLVEEREVDTIPGQTAVYLDVANDIKNTHFRPFDIPTKDWIQEYAESYAKAIDISDGGNND